MASFDPCPICAMPATTDEHVWPTWLMEHFGPEDGPYTSWIDGEPVVNRDGDIRSQTSVGSWKLKMCGRCNGDLNTRFEQPTKLIIRRVLRGEAARLDQSESELFGLWWVKTLLLLAHPRTHCSIPGINPEPWEPFDSGLTSWLCAGTSPPDGLSAWLLRRGEDGPGETARVPLPTVTVDERTTVFRAKRSGIDWLDVSLVYHPGWPVDHPLEPDLARRIWPCPAGGLDLDLPPSSPRAMSWLHGPRVHVSIGVRPDQHAPPLSAGLDFRTLVGSVLDQVRW